VGTTVSNIPPPGTPLVEILPDLGPDAYYLSFLPRGRRLEPVIADPSRWHVNQPAPIASETSTGPRLWKQTTDASFRAPPIPRGGLVPYTQIVRPSSQPGDEDLGSPFELFRPVSHARTDPMSLVYQYSEMKLPRLREFAVDLLNRLAMDNPELGAARDRADRRRSFELDPVDFERVGRAFNNYLANSGEYTYSLTTRRIERSYDPIEDFLFLSKEGSCERFATALVLLLRAVGVPAVYVLGFKGCEHEGNGVYAIRQDHAHAWVEILVPRPAPPGFPFARRVGNPAPTEVWHWLSLDPTPTGTTEGNSGTFEDWLGSARETWATFFLDFIVGYNTDRRQRTVEAIQAWVTEWWWGLLTVPLVGLTAWGGRRAIRRLWPTRSDSETGFHTEYPWFDRLSAVLASCGLVRPPGWTPRELAGRSSRSLLADPRTALVADIPLRVTMAFYRARYANRPPDAGEVRSLEEAVDRLEKTVTSAGWTDLAEERA
jgi:transglutaminase-like putative cysteine protease